MTQHEVKIEIFSCFAADKAANYIPGLAATNIGQDHHHCKTRMFSLLFCYLGKQYLRQLLTSSSQDISQQIL